MIASQQVFTCSTLTAEMLNKMSNVVNSEHISHTAPVFLFDFEHVNANNAVFLETVVPIILGIRHFDCSLI